MKKSLYISIVLVIVLAAYLWFSSQNKKKEKAILWEAIDAEEELDADDLESLLIGVKAKNYEGVEQDAMAIHEATNQYFLPFLDDVDSIIEIIEDKSVEQLVAIDKAFEQLYGYRLVSFLKDSIAISDYQRINAVVLHN
jgi:hypothetical protein